jgi:toxin ParE1/3/4
VIVDITQAARRDLGAAYDFIAQDRPLAARRVVTTIVASARRLGRFPHRGRPGALDGTRELSVRRTGYFLVYRVEADRVMVLRVIHGRQEWP